MGEPIPAKSALEFFRIVGNLKVSSRPIDECGARDTDAIINRDATAPTTNRMGAQRVGCRV